VTVLVDFLAELWLYVAGALTVLLAILASGHAILYKRDSRAAVAWVGLIWFAPVVGAVLYAMFGINRIRRHASDLRPVGRRLSGTAPLLTDAATVLATKVDGNRDHLIALGTLVDQVTRRPLTDGNAIEYFVNGDEAYPRMLAAIDGATRTVALSTYIFDHDASGLAFADALDRAVQRGVSVRVLVDAVGSRYSWPPMVGVLRKRGVRVARFLPTYLPWRAPFWNLRNHRKILVTDGRVGFTGGMNIRRHHQQSTAPGRPMRDMHFEMRGPVVRQFMETFAEDWAFTTKEVLEGPDWFPELAARGAIAARGITDGPDEDFEKLRWTIQGAIATARRSVRVVTPYFLPDAAMISALNIAALRGVTVEIILPSRSNLPVVQWASNAILWQLVKRGCDVYWSPPPFDHTKLVVVDGAWTLFGSANWDPRSLRLNFEFNVECYDTVFGGKMEALFAARRDAARGLTGEDLDRRPLWIRVRDGIARLFSPYL